MLGFLRALNFLRKPVSEPVAVAEQVQSSSRGVPPFVQPAASQPGAPVSEPAALVSQPVALVAEPAALVSQPGALVFQPVASVPAPDAAAGSAICRCCCLIC